MSLGRPINPTHKFSSIFIVFLVLFAQLVNVSHSLTQLQKQTKIDSMLKSRRFFFNLIKTLQTYYIFLISNLLRYDTFRLLIRRE